MLKHLKNIEARLRKRAGLISAIRVYFDGQGFIEVETPIVINAPAPEEYIEGIPVENNFLRTSPRTANEANALRWIRKNLPDRGMLPQKRVRRAGIVLNLLCSNGIKPKLTIYNFWDFTAELLRSAAQKTIGASKLEYQGQNIDLSLEPQIITVKDAYKKYADIDVDKISSEEDFDEIMTSQIEPCLGIGQMTFLIDYPANRAALARLKPENSEVAERWELYLAGMEIANAYGELTNPAEQRKRFEEAQTIRSENNFVPYPFPDDFFKALESGMPECSGCALGVDRLAMIFTDTADIADIKIQK